MAYADITGLVSRYQPIKTMIGTSSFDVSSVDVSSVYIAQAESLIDAYIGGRYEVPLTVVPPLITMIACDLSIFYMLAERSPAVPEFMDKRHERAMSLLMDIKSGTIFVNSATPVSTVRGDNYAYSPTMDYHPIFSPVLSDIDQTADSDRVDADEDVRDDD